MEINPYAAPQSQVLQMTTQDEIVRREHLNTEASIKTIGILYYLGGVALISISVISLTSEGQRNGGYILLLGVSLLLVGAGMGVAAYGLRRLKSWARPLTILISSLAVIVGLINLSWAVVIHIYILAQMLGSQGKFVMAPEYQRIIAATPHVKRKTSIVMIVVLLVLVVLLVILISIGVSVSMRR
jgi:hypothetical protein